MKIRERTYEIIEVSKEDDKASLVYDLIMLFSIMISIIPLTFKEAPEFFFYTDIITAVIFIIDYFLRWMTADMKTPQHKAWAFFIYPLTPWAIIDLLSILPVVTALNSSFKIVRLLRLFKTFKVFRTMKVFKTMAIFRVLKAMRYSHSLEIILTVINKSKEALLAVCTLAAGYIFVSALIIFNVENDTFNNFFDAVYWATVSLTTVGYGDIYPVTTIGRVITMISSVFGIAIVALPAGIITAGYMDTINEEKNQK